MGDHNEQCEYDYQVPHHVFLNPESKRVSSSKILHFFKQSELIPNSDPEKSTDCQMSTFSYVKKQSTNMPSPQLTFSTSLSGMNQLNLQNYIQDSDATTSWSTCQSWCLEQEGVSTPHADMTFQGFCTLACHYGNIHFKRKPLRRPACKEFPKALSKHAIQVRSVRTRECHSNHKNVTDLYITRTPTGHVLDGK